MFFRGKGFRKSKIKEDYFQQDHRDTDDDDVLPLSPSVTPQKREKKLYVQDMSG